MPRSEAVTGGTLVKSLLIRTKPNRKSFTSVGENKCVSLMLKKRVRTGRSYGKFSAVDWMLLDSVEPMDSCRSPAPKGRNESACEKKNRALSLSVPPRNSRSQFAVN